MEVFEDFPPWVQTESEQRLFLDFRVFLWLLWEHLKLPPPTALQYAIAEYVANGPDRRMVQAFRGAAKSWITCAYVLWRLYRNPQERVKIISANEDKALENATFIRRLIDEVELLRFLRPNQGQRDSTLKFDVGPSDANPAPSVSCVGIKGQLTGGRATIVVADDVEVPKNALTEVMREQLAELVKEFDALVVPEGFDIVYLGTPQTEQSIYRKVRERGYDVRVWPVRYPSVAQVDKYDGTLAPELAAAVRRDPSLAGRSTEPSRFDDMDLAGRELSYGRSGFALQFMLDTSLADLERYPLKTGDFVCMDVDRHQAPAKIIWTSDPRNAWDIDNIGFNGDRLYRPMHISDTFLTYQSRLMVVDPSGRGSNETAYVVLYHLAGMLFLVATGGFTDGYSDQTLTGLASLAKDHRVNTVLVESNMGDGMFSALLKPHLDKIHPVSLEEVRAGGQKEVRIISDLEPVLNQHRLVIDAGVARKDLLQGTNSLLYQLTHLTRDRGSLRQDDRVDCLAHGARWFRSVLQQDAKAAEDVHLARLRDAELRGFTNKFYGHNIPKPTFAGTNRALRR